MIIESVKIKNIRSIKSQEIHFLPSTMLFYGDIGSGKSSVLKSIEFGLFGILSAAELNSYSLLRRGTTKGSVELTFSINNNKYIVKRSLKKKSNGVISQEKGKLIVFTKEGKQEIQYAPVDLRRKVLEILNYSVTRYEKAQKIPLFRYTVYTPQEQVKEILQAKPDDRFEILKEVFGIEKYEIALKNLDPISSHLKDTLKELKIHLSHIGEPKSEIKNVKLEIQNLEELINNLKKDSQNIEKAISEKEIQIEKLQSKLNSFVKKSVLIIEKEQNIVESNKKIKSKTSDLNSLKIEILDLKRRLEQIPKIKLDTDLDKSQIETLIQKKSDLKLEKEGRKAIISQKLKDINKLMKEGKCSLCGQAIHEKSRFKKELNEIKEELNKLDQELEHFSKEINELKSHSNKVEEINNNNIKKESINSLLKEKQKRDSQLKQLIKELKVNLEKNKKSIEQTLKEFKMKDLKEFKQLEQQLKSNIEENKEELTKLNKNKNNFDKEIITKQAFLSQNKKELENLKEKLNQKKTLLNKITILTSIKNWIGDQIPILLRDIEREILASSASQFNDYFKNWFQILVGEENIEVEIKPDDFQPIIHVNGYESPFEDLSGGEKSALSLAYRLALNKIINERYQEVKTKDLLILDEPTDGFSQQQINRMQEILGMLNTSQMIVISHDRNLDSFVTEVYNFQKSNHQTKVIKEEI